MAEGAGDGSGRATGLAPGALTALLQEVAASPDKGVAEPLSLPPGTVLGRFEIIRELGRGGFGVVYEAKDRDLGRQVAVKVVRPGRIVEEEGKVSREAEAIARLSHPNLITLFEVGRSEHGPFLVFELLRGKTLDLRIEEGPLPVQEAVHVATEVARGLAHAHAEGVIHRDLKPGNVFVTNKGQVKILDFGMAHAFGRRRLSGGTPGYMAPEQWEDDPEDERTDVFALGVMLYRMLTGEYPFPEGKGKWSAEPVTPRKLEVPGAPELAELVEKMLDRTPKGRPRDGAAVLAALTPIEDKLRAKPADGSPPVHAKRRKATFGDLLAELRRRHVFRVMIGYGIFAFAVLQVTEPVMHGAELPDWVLKAVLVALVLGFPVAVILAWIYDLTAQGVKRTPSSADPAAPRFGRSRFLLPVAVSVGVLAIATAGAGGWYAWKHAPGSRSVQAAWESPSIAVLPFKDLSPNHDQEYLSEGIAEEVLGALSRVRGMRVAGRSSSFWFKGRSEEPGEIARKLGVTYLLEGSVRRSGNRVRVSTEIVKPSSAERIWSQDYDREVSDVFALQDEIARAVVQAVAPVLFAGGVILPPSRRTDPEAYRLFLLGRSQNSQGTERSYRDAIETLERAAIIDPGFVPTQTFLAFAYGNLSRITEGEERVRLQKAFRVAAERAVELDPNSAWGYAPRALSKLLDDLDWKGATADLDRASAIDPSNLFVLNARALLLAALGKHREAVELERRVVDQDPLGAIHTLNLASFLTSDGRYTEAREWARRAREISPGNSRTAWVAGWAALLSGDASAALVEFEKLSEAHGAMARSVALHALGREQESRESLARFEREQPDQLILIAGARAWRGDKDGAFDLLQSAVRRRAPELAFLRRQPFVRPLEGDPRFAAVLASMGLPTEGVTVSSPGAGAADLPPSIAVLPFADMSPKHDQEYFADGVAEEILTSLTRVKGLKVIGRTSSFSFKGKPDDIQAIGRKLNVHAILEGSVRKQGPKLRITANMVRVEDGSQIWTKTFDGDQARVFAVQEEVARSVAEALRVKLLPGEDLAERWVRTREPEAYNQLLLGRQFMRQGTLDDFKRARAAFEKAAAIDPGYAAAWTGVSQAIIATLSLDRDDPELRRKALAAADRAVAVAPDVRNAYITRAWARRKLLFDWAGALADLDTAARLGPGDEEIDALRAELRGAPEPAAEAIRRAQSDVERDPLNPAAWMWLGAEYVAAENYARAGQALARALEIAPGHVNASWIECVRLVAGGHPGEALALAQRSSIEWLQLACTAFAQHDLGREKESKAALDALVERWADGFALQVAEVHAWRGDPDRAFEWLERAYTQRDNGMLWLRTDPFLRKLHGDRRWMPFLRKMTLPAD